MPAVLLATCAQLPAGDDDADLLVSALTERGVDARWVIWTDPDVDWTAGLVVLRATWDYTFDLPAFLDWVHAVPRVANEAAVVAWNTDKVYLRDLEAAGIPIVPTTFVAPTETTVLFGGGAAGPGAGELVVKPSVGAGSRGAGRFSADQADAARTHLQRLQAAGRTALVQPYLEAVDEAGETALIYVDGRLSHAIRKGPLLPPGTARAVDAGALYAEERIEAKTPLAAELAIGAAVMDFVRDRFGADQLYARVDLLPSPAGPLVVELELAEPSLFLQDGIGDHEPVDAFATAIAERA
ncbi:MAG: RimK family alpha-L-glutamate ligase [Jatrophihabitans sp.]|uniref:ATP-grasp domain-containing protein n=1 Tax=Jatrophihabitans sp. TaxID=1932789 RepID=UPI003911FD60